MDGRVLFVLIAIASQMPDDKAEVAQQFTESPEERVNEYIYCQLDTLHWGRYL